MPELTIEDAKKDLQGLVNEKKAEAQKEKEANMSETEKKAQEAEQKKAQEEKATKEAQATKDAEILAKKPEELSEEEKQRRAVIDEEKRKEEEAKLSVEEKIKRVKEESQKRIDEITNELKQIKDKNSKEAESLKKELEIQRKENELLNKKISQPDKKDDSTSVLRDMEQKRITKYLEDDAGKPREERREMSREELEEWLIDDVVAAQEWLAERTLRRSRERQSDSNKLKKDNDTNEFTRKQSESNVRVLIRHPELDTTKREAELKALGKTDAEIQETLTKENEKYRICSEIVKSDPAFYLTKENGPELVMQELEKRLSNKSAPTQTEDQKKIDELTAKVEELTAVIENLSSSDEGINSTTIKKRPPEGKLTEAEQSLVNTMKDLNMPQSAIDSALKKHRAGKR